MVCCKVAALVSFSSQMIPFIWNHPWKLRISLNVVMLMLPALQEPIATDPLWNELQKRFIFLAMWNAGDQLCIPETMLVCVQIYKHSFIHAFVFQAVRLGVCVCVFLQRNFWQVNYDRAKQRHFRASTISHPPPPPNERREIKVMRVSWGSWNPPYSHCCVIKDSFWVFVRGG